MREVMAILLVVVLTFFITVVALRRKAKRAKADGPADGLKAAPDDRTNDQEGQP
jgi:uncharacterized membrane protein YecN with MAPEG domain